MDDLWLQGRALPTEAIRALDRHAIEELGLPGVVLMENAGRRAADEAWGLVQGRVGARVAVIAGRGNNGGDGYVVARHLHNRGARVECHHLGAIGEASPRGDARLFLDVARRMGIPVVEHRGPGLPGLGDSLERDSDLVVDAILGTGLAGPVRGLDREGILAIHAAAARGVPVLAIDVPSGLDADTGEVLGVAVRATRTVTFAAPKLGFARGEGPAHAGVVVLADISIPRERYPA
ncbi:MAG: NAD(P)H-hydrate epimerase [Planctomycetes bacterium]|nr:NAD(P)H-hydrate epimerase [Planctomycetota bacterium]